MVGGHRIPEDAQCTSPADFRDGAGLHPELGEERRLLDVGGVAVPLVNVAHARRDFVPLRILGREVGVECPEDLGLEGRLQGVAHLGEAGPDVLQEHRSVRALADGLGGQVLVNPASQREGHHQRRRHQEVGLDVLMDAGFEVAVARQDRGSHQVVLQHRFFDLGVERTRVADAGGAAVAHRLEAQLIEVGLEPGLVEVIGDHSAARG